MATNDPYKALRAEFKAKLVEKANALQSTVQAGGMAAIEEELENHSLAFGVWQDEQQADGVGCMIVKGETSLKIVAGMEPAFTLDMKCTAIPCTCAEQAHALRLTLGDGRPV